MSVIEVSVAGRGCFLRRPRPRLIGSRMVFLRGVFLRRPGPRFRGSRIVFSEGCSSGYSSSILLSGSDLGPVPIRKYSFTVVGLKSVGPLGNCTLYVSLLSTSKVYSPVYLLLWPVLPLRQTSTSKLRGRSYTGVVLGPFR